MRGTDFNYFEAHGGWGHMVRLSAALSATCCVSQHAIYSAERAQHATPSVALPPVRAADALRGRAGGRAARRVSEATTAFPASLDGPSQGRTRMCERG